jgi:hypothetical protein
MYRKHLSGQLSIKEFHVHFGGTLDPDNRWVHFSSLMGREELDVRYSPEFNPTTSPPANPVRLVFRALFIMQRLSLTDERDRRTDPSKRLHAVYPLLCGPYQQYGIRPIDDGSFLETILRGGAHSDK